MSTAVFVIATIFSIATAVFVLWLFVWAARKDGEYDRAMRARMRRNRRP